MTLRQFTILAFACCSAYAIADTGLTQYVDTRVGTAASTTLASGTFGKNTEELGQTLPAVLAPYSMNFWTPQTRDTERKCVAPYYYADSLLQGFRCSHWIVGGCTQDYGSFTIMPLSGQLRCSPHARASKYHHSDEVAKPYYYRAELPEEQISAEMTATPRAGIFRFQYNNPNEAILVINPNNDEEEGFVAVDTARNMVYGYNPVHRIYQGKGLAAGYSGHFVIEFDHKIKDFGVYAGNNPYLGIDKIGNANDIGCYVVFDDLEDGVLLAKAACSFTSHQGALNNLNAELPGWDFDATKSQLQGMWEDWLSRIKVESDNTEDLHKFYTAMYHASFLPHDISDADGQYPSFSTGYPIQTLQNGEDGYYDDFSTWDTYRALHPLIHLIAPNMGGNMVQSLVRKYEQGGWLPIFPCWNSYTAAMIGDHCSAVIADAYCKDIRNFDAEKAYEAVRKNAFEVSSTWEYTSGKGRRAMPSYLRYGYIPLEDSVPEAYHKKEQVSRTMEYAYDDFAAATLAKALGKDEDYRQLISRSRNYRNVINPATGWADGRNADGTFAFDNPFAFTKHITEGAPCHYTWYAPHDPYGLIEAVGGKVRFIEKLDTMFAERMYWHGNEPCHQVAYMYNFVGQPWKTAREIRKIMRGEYLNAPGGLSGNDDAGQMSAWYVFGALGFYPVCPASPYYMIGSPTFNHAAISLENGNTIEITANDVTPDNIYIQQAYLNGTPYPYNYISHQELIKGGVWQFDMGPNPNTKWGNLPEHCPPEVD